jgi:hypothetical protein
VRSARVRGICNLENARAARARCVDRDALAVTVDDERVTRR